MEYSGRASESEALNGVPRSYQYLSLLAMSKWTKSLRQGQRIALAELHCCLVMARHHSDAVCLSPCHPFGGVEPSCVTLR